MTLKELLKKMELDWDERARENARQYVATGKQNWTDTEFFQSGERTVAEHIHNDMGNICQGNQPAQMRVLEIGCGVGRVTRSLGKIFGEVHGVDVSGEMVRLASTALADMPNIYIHQNNGMDLEVLGDLQFDFAFSSIVFQHIPALAIIENYVGEVHRLLRPGALFKFQVQGVEMLRSSADDTWLGAPVSDQKAVDIALRYGFEPRYRHGAGQRDFWLWYFKKQQE